MFNRKIFTLGSLFFAVFFTGLGFWYLIAQVIIDPLNFVPLFTSLIILSFYLSLLSVASIIIQNHSQFLGLAILGNLPAIIILSAFDIGLIIPALALLFLILGTQAYYLKLKSDQKLFVRPNLTYLIANNFGLIFISLAFVLSVTYYAYAHQSLTQSPLKVPESIIDQAVKFAIGLVGPSGAQKSDVPPQLLEAVVINPLKDALRTQIDTLLAEYRNFIAPILATSFFLTLMALGTLIRTFTTVFSYFLLKLLVLFKVIKIAKETREVEVYTLTD